MAEPVLELGRQQQWEPFLPTNSWRALKQWLLRTPELSLVSLAGTRCSNNQVPVLKLNTNPELVSHISQLKAILDQVPAFYPLNTFLTVFPFSQWIPWSAFHLNDYSPRKYLSSLISLHWVLLKDCLGLFGLVVINWATCSNPTFLGDHDPKYREVATYNLGIVWGCFHLSFSLHLVPSTSLTSNLLLTAPPMLLSPLFIY